MGASGVGVSALPGGAQLGQGTSQSNADAGAKLKLNFHMLQDRIAS